MQETYYSPRYRQRIRLLQMVLNHLKHDVTNTKIHESIEKKLPDCIAICETPKERNEIESFLKRLVTNDKK